MSAFSLSPFVVAWVRWPDSTSAPVASPGVALDDRGGRPVITAHAVEQLHRTVRSFRRSTP